MKNSPIKVDYRCRNCEHEFEIEVTPTIPAQTYGPPESCYPSEGGEVSVECCPECEAPVDEDAAREKASDALRSAAEDYADMEREDRY